MRCIVAAGATGTIAAGTADGRSRILNAYGHREKPSTQGASRGHTPRARRFDAARPSVIITLRAVVICIPRRSGRRHLGQFVAQPAVKPAGRDVYGCAHARKQRGRAATHSNDTAHCEVVDKTSAEQVASLGGWRCLDWGEIGKRSAKGLGAREKAT